MLIVSNLSVKLKDKPLLADISFSVKPGTVLACMGANGSGKSSLAATIMGHPHYQITAGTINFFGEDITNLGPDKRAKMGLFLSLQQPFAIPGVTLSTLLREAFRAIHGPDQLDFYIDRLTLALKLLQLDPALLQRPVHEGFSGGEKKKCEMVQLLVLQPKLAILDEIDSGLDVDALKQVGTALQAFKKLCPESSLILITHYQRLLEFITPDNVMIIEQGVVVEQGGAHLITKIEKDGYGKRAY